MRAPRRKGAAGRKRIERRHRPRDGSELLAGKVWRGAQQRLRVWMLGMMQNFERGTLFDDAARIHYRDMIGDTSHHAQIVSDEKKR